MKRRVLALLLAGALLAGCGNGGPPAATVDPPSSDPQTELPVVPPPVSEVPPPETASPVDNSTVLCPDIVGDFSVAVSPGGAAAAVAVFTRLNPETSRWDLVACRRDGEGWTTPVPVNPEAPWFSCFAQCNVAIDNAGNATLAWQQNTPGYEVAVRRWNADGSWGATTVISDPSQAWSGDPVLGLDGAGNAVVLWNESPIAGFNPAYSRTVYARRWLAASGEWEPWATLGAAGISRSGLSLDSAGNPVATWVAGTPETPASVNAPGNTIYVRRLSSGTWGAAESIAAGGVSAISPSLVFDPSGDALMLWTRKDTSYRYHTVQARYDAEAATWGAPVLFAEDTRVRAAVADRGGNLLALYNRTFARYDAASGDWSPALPMVGGAGSDCALTLEPDGSIRALWSAYRVVGEDYAYDLLTSRLPAGSDEWETPTAVLTGTSYAPRYLALLPASDGSHLAVWNCFVSTPVTQTSYQRSIWFR